MSAMGHVLVSHSALSMDVSYSGPARADTPNLRGVARVLHTQTGLWCSCGLALHSYYCIQISL